MQPDETTDQNLPIFLMHHGLPCDGILAGKQIQFF